VPGTTTRRELTTADGVTLEAELALPDGPPRAGVVLCHPHPTYGGTMHAFVPAVLFAGLPAHGIAALRFNFRGVGRSGGAHTGGEQEPLDVAAAVADLAGALAPGTPVALQGWSFGGVMALTVTDPAVAGWYAVAPPVAMLRPQGLGPLGADPRPKLIVAGSADDVCTPASVAELTDGWVATETVVVPGADHFFGAHGPRLVELGVGFVDTLA
jgi:alpha/beta superfamily hydrolase